MHVHRRPRRAELPGKLFRGGERRGANQVEQLTLARGQVHT
jgi:hypothetical protein